MFRRLSILACLLVIHSNFALADDSYTDKPEVNAECSQLFAGDPNKGIVILDTNVIVENPNVIYEYPDADVFIPLKVLAELDKFKMGFDDRGLSARSFSRTVAKLRSNGSLMEGVPLPNGSVLKLGSFSPEELGSLNLPKSFDISVPDDEIIATALFLARQYEGKDVRLISDDTLVLLKSDTVDLPASYYISAKKSLARESIFSGVSEQQLSEADFRELELRGELSYRFEGQQPNEYVILTSKKPPILSVKPKSLAARYDADTNKLVLLKPAQELDLPVYPRNKEQEVALDLLMNPDIELVTIMGSSGTGKTLMAMLAGLKQALWTKEPLYDEVLISAAFVEMGKGVGFLPGGLEEKSAPYMQPFYDNLQFIADMAAENSWSFGPAAEPKKSSKNQRPYFLKSLNSKQFRHIRKIARDSGRDLEDVEFLKEMYKRFEKDYDLKEFDPDVSSSKNANTTNDYNKLTKGKVNMIAMPMIRGRTWPRRFIIVDEAQNLTPHEVETLITRAGEGTKIVLLGDVTQIDLPHLNAYNNGLSLVIELFKSEPIAGHISLQKTERSRLVETAVRVFEQQKGI